MRRKIRCTAHNRRGEQCGCKAMSNGKCKFHGGMSTGPRTREGKRRAMANLPRAAKSLLLDRSQPFGAVLREGAPRALLQDGLLFDRNGKFLRIA